LIAKAGPALYRLNLIRDLREREFRVERRKRLAVILGLGCFGFFLLSLIYSALTMWQMERVLSSEKDKLNRLQQEYRKYTATRLIVDKSDIELLSGLQGKGIFWTRKLAAMAKHLPDNYWITSFKYSNGELRVMGYGLAGPRQDQLMILDDYTNQLRTDTSFADVFPIIYLNSAERREEGGRVGFDFSAVTKNWKGQ
jgi:hypothetical protein